MVGKLIAYLGGIVIGFVSGVFAMREHYHRKKARRNQ